ncbi:hypothetical protein DONNERLITTCHEN_00110 [Janthinobacterium phage vB_JliS-Donnerlittchen]|uniref:Uncharacterized protein n=1 Tax=Janthinobacterium phage vB_JliS-Donnerlittchen TaxID=2948610 RepID=A0A9E7SM33_9CAUD|nr:hypothetical protein P9A49_gp12 [Janthinobacterium phage vB_JliM-Donnerlittchen]USN14412.1 hypothetical protein DONNERLITTCHEN_00110 [Janthinobacterium phage vB_JliM-Donnerlittchen]
MIDYPEAELPIPQADYSAKVITNTATTTFASGRPRRRRLGVGKYHAAKLNWQLSPEEYDFFMGWWEHVLKLGTAPFSIVMATGALLGPHSVLLVGDPESTLQDYFWKVSCDAVILGKPELPEYEVALRAQGTQVADFPALEDGLNTVVNIDYPAILEG